MSNPFPRRTTLGFVLATLCALSCRAYTPPPTPGTWTEQSPASHPSARYFHAMAYVGADKVLLFGGYTPGEGGGEATVLPAETWVYDVSDDTWTLMSPATEPPARAFHAMAHIGDDQALLFGGDTDDDDEYDSLLSDTWVYDLSENTWTQKSLGAGPEGRIYHAMAYAGWDQVLLFGGGPAGDAAEETWLFDLSANSWTDLTNGMAPDAREGHAMTHLGVAEDLGRTLFGGGEEADIGHIYGFENDTWSYGNPSEGWGEADIGPGPSARTYHSMAYLQLGYVVLFGGLQSPSNVIDETWIFDIFVDDETWVRQFANPSPPARAGAAMAHGGQGVAVLFGGDGETEVLDDTWTFRPAAALGITVTPVSGLMTTELGGTATFEISANTPPESHVDVPLTSSDPGEGTVPATVTLPQGSTDPVTVTVTGIPDGIIDGDIGFSIETGDPSSGDGRYDFLEAHHVEDVSVTNWDADAPRIEIQGNSRAIANGDTTPSGRDHTDFGRTQLGTPIERTFEIHSEGAIALELTGVPIVATQGSADFAVMGLPDETTVEPGEWVEFTIRCTPNTLGHRTAEVVIASSDPDDDPFEFTVECSGGEAPSMLVLGNGNPIPSGDESPSEEKHTVFPLANGEITRTYAILNRGGDVLLLYDDSPHVEVGHPQFSVSSPPKTLLDPGETAYFDVTFTRGEDLYVETSVSIASTDEDQDPYTFEIIGTVDGASPELRADAGPDQTVLVGAEVFLDGTGSHDRYTASSAGISGSSVRPKALVSYRWEFKADRSVPYAPVWIIPEGSACPLTARGFDTPIASFIADVEGAYTLVLEVINSEGEAASDEVTVVAVTEFPAPETFHFDDFRCWPNPFASTIVFGFDGAGIPDRMSISIYDLGRNLVWSETIANVDAIVWDGQAVHGERLANGPYIAVVAIEGNGNTFITKRVIFLSR